MNNNKYYYYYYYYYYCACSFYYYFIFYDFFSQSGERTASPSKPQIEPAQPLQKTRRLPSWLMESTSSEARSSLKKEGNRKGKAPAGEVL